MSIRVPALAVAAALLLALAPASAAGAASAGPLAETAAKKRCKKGYVLKTVKRTQRVQGRVRTVRVKRCVKRKRTAAAKQPAPPQVPPLPPVAPDPLPLPQPEPQPQPQPPPPVEATCPTPHTGRATGMDGVFQYGDVRIDRTCGEVTRVEIKSVSTQCNTGSFTFIVVFDPSSPDIAILEGSNQIAGDKMHVVYQPDKTSANQTTMDITFTGNTAQGEFHSIGNCKQDGLFTATAG